MATKPDGGRVPAAHRQLIIDIATERGEVPRFVLAKELQRRAGIQRSTAMDYILSSAKEGLLEQVGLNFRVRQEHRMSGTESDRWSEFYSMLVSGSREGAK